MFSHRANSQMATVMIDILYGPSETEARSRKECDHFNQWFSRCHKTLQFMADLILGGFEKADCAVQNCWIRASRNPPSFESEGAFRGWLMRLLIDEALSILHQAYPRGLKDNKHL